MSSHSTDRRSARHRRHRRVRRRVQGTGSRPRLTVFRSAKHISAQLVDDSTQSTLASATTLQQGVADGLTGIEAAAAVGRIIAERSKAVGVGSVVFDRGGYLYHGRVAALAEAARKAGLEF